jgi:four helix bundle protein
MPPLFDHEKLHVYQRSIAFIAWAESILERLPKTLDVRSQLDRAGTSIPLNIAEGNGKFTAPDRCRFFDTARGSALECAACLDVTVAKGRLSSTEIEMGKSMLAEIVAMLVGLIRTNSKGNRVFEDVLGYGEPNGDAL